MIVNTQADKTQASILMSLLKGLTVQVSNPKTVFIIASIFSSVMPNQPPFNTALYVTVIAFLIDFGWYALVALSLSKQASRDFYQKAKRYFDWFAAGLLLVLGAKLIFELL